MVGQTSTLLFNELVLLLVALLARRLLVPYTLLLVMIDFIVWTDQYSWDAFDIFRTTSMHIRQWYPGSVGLRWSCMPGVDRWKDRPLVAVTCSSVPTRTRLLKRAFVGGKNDELGNGLAHLA